MYGTKLFRRLLLGGVIMAAGVGSLDAQVLTAEYEPATAESQDFDLTIRNIMRGPELIGQSPVGVSWTDDGDWIYFRWLPGGGEWTDARELYRVRADGGAPERVPDEVGDTISLQFADGDLSDDGRYRIRSFQGDLWLIDREDDERTRLTHTTAGEGQPRFAAGDQGVFYRSGTNLFHLDLESGAIRQLTDIQSGGEDGEEPEAEGQRGNLVDQQEELFEHIRVDNLRRERRDEAQERAEALRLPTVHLGARERIGSLEPNPQGTLAVLTAFTPAQGSENTIVPDWVTDSGYTENLNARSKVGDVQSSSRAGLLNIETGEVTWLDVVEDSTSSAEGQPQLAGGGFDGWNDAGTHALVSAIDFDYKGFRIYSLEAATGELTLLESVEDEAWVGGPCFQCMGWVPGMNRIWFVSEATDWAHLYTINADGSDRRALTSGEWEVRSVEIPEGWDRFLLHTSETSAFDTQPWAMDFDGSDKELLLDEPGIHNVEISPDGERMAVVHSSSRRPPELFVAEAEEDAELTRVTTSPVGDFLAFPWKEAEIVHFEAEDGTMVPARIYRPSDMGAEPNGAGVVFVHGAGYLQNVHNGWSSYYREWMFHHFLAAEGYTVLDIDYRGSAGHGRDWRTATYRWMGGKDLSDQVDGARWLEENEGVDADRLGIYGGSYGGFITLMALFTEPGVFEAGAALRSVTDWAHYNHWYTSRILNQPQDDDEAYRMSSPIYHAEGLEGHLLILHGMVDTNVHFSDVVRLAQRLIELGKEDWEMAVFPVEGHGFTEPTSWTDEYRRIFELFDETIGEGVTVEAHATMNGG